MRQCLDFGKIHHHSVIGAAFSRRNLTGERNFNNIAMAMKIMALTFMIGYPVTSIEFKTARDEHEKTIEQKYPALSFLVYP